MFVGRGRPKESAAIIETLLAHGADPVHRDFPHPPPLMVAAENAAPAVLLRLIKAGADLNTLHAYNGASRTPLMISVEHASGIGGMEQVRVLLDAGAEINKLNSEGETALIIEAKELGEGHGDVAVLDLLVDHGANLNARDNTGYTPLKAIKSGKLATYPLRRDEYTKLIAHVLSLGARD